MYFSDVIERVISQAKLVCVNVTTSYTVVVNKLVNINNAASHGMIHCTMHGILVCSPT